MGVGRLLLLLIAACFLLAVFKPIKANPDASTTPEQVHIALTGKPEEMSIMWATQSSTKTTTVKYSTNSANLTLTTTGSSSRYLRSPYIHAAKLVSLQKDTKYYYQVGDEIGGWSQVFSFHTESDSLPLVFAVIGDHGTSSNSQMVFDTMVEFDKKQSYKFLVHAGDLSYADGLESRWDTWGNMIQPLSSHVPWMVAAGNHEIFDLFVTYQNRFRMPPNGDKGNLFYSFNYGLVHHITLDSETISYSHLLLQYKWLKNDLEKVNRKQTPWTLVLQQ
jgi:phosphodiesterase/alkaline phosphatase D-like protein